jgi:integrase
MMRAENIDWQSRVLAYSRPEERKSGRHPDRARTGSHPPVLPANGPLFPYLRTVRCCDRATEFRQRCEGLGIRGVTPHCYRYSWPQRAKALGYPERWANRPSALAARQSTALHAAGDGSMEVPSLDAWRRRLTARWFGEFDRGSSSRV